MILGIIYYYNRIDILYVYKRKFAGSVESKYCNGRIFRKSVVHQLRYPFIYYDFTQFVCVYFPRCAYLFSD